MHVACLVVTALAVAATGFSGSGGRAVLFLACAVHTHPPAGDYSAQFVLANGFLVRAGAALALGVAGT